ncbi:MAG TPA: thiol reductase thioredoxin [Opitutae bacterium]|nr:thiol reductase thioredoxin [Opitutae bacterium]|tara:strand:+ start:3606 stop:3920 length:315 start_codon:yes stop_codon:yes gene_type:complete
MLQELTEDNLGELVAKESRVLVKYSAGWCGNCRIMKPKFRKSSEEFENVMFVIVDAEKFPDSRKLAEVDNLPTFAAFKDGSLVNQVQTNKAEVLKEFVDEAASD